MTSENDKRAKATFAGGCFWCMEPPFDSIEGVIATTPGYCGGHQDNPTYEEVCSGTTGHTEALQVTYDPDKVSYQELLDVFWRNINPADAEGQFVDRGSQYRPAIFYHDEQQRLVAEQSRHALGLSGRFNAPIATEIVPLKKFHPAEEHHQNYYQKCPLRYKTYRYNSGRDQFLKKIWQDKE